MKEEVIVDIHAASKDSEYKSLKELNKAVNNKADIEDVYTKEEVERLLEDIVNNTYTKEEVDNIIKNVVNVKGSTTERPSDLAEVDAGFKYFDTTLGKPIYWEGERWVDYNGYTAVKSKGTTNERPVGRHLENDEYVGDLIETDKGFKYYDTDLNTWVYAVNINSETGEVDWVDYTYVSLNDEE